MRFIVTGGAGFIGSNLVRELAKRYPDCKLTVVDDFSSASFKNLQDYRGDVIAKPCEELDWDYYFGELDVDRIFHLASITDTTVTNEREMVERNVEGMRRVMRFAVGSGCKVVYASSGATYGQVDGIMREDQPPAPANVYGFSKMVLDNIARDAARICGATVLGVRYFNVYGPREAHKGKMASMVYQLYRQIKRGERPKVFRNGEHKRDFVYVKDAVNGTILAGESDKPGVYNIGCGQAISFNDVISHLNKALGTDIAPEYIKNPYEAFYQHHTEADLANSRAGINYEPEWMPDRGIADYIAWLEKH